MPFDRYLSFVDPGRAQCRHAAAGGTGASESDGLALVEEIQRVFSKRAPKIILVAGRAAGFSAARGSTLLAGRIVKPLLPFQFVRAVMAALGHQAPSLESRTQVSLQGAGLSVLLAEDNRINQEVARRTLEKRGCRVVIASDGLEAIQAFDKDEFDVILMDVLMPRLGGLEATAEIRAREAGRSHILIIALTASAMAGDRERCLEAGMDGFVCKPLVASSLFDEISRLTLPAHTLAK